MTMTMTKSKATIITAVIFVVTTGLMFLLCANAHIDFFPCKETTREHASSFGESEGPLVTKDSTCSLMSHLRTDRFDRAEKEELTGVGWAMLFAFCLGIAAADAALIYVVLSKKIDSGQTSKDAAA